MMNYQILINKENPLSDEYVPENLVEYTEYNGVKIDNSYKTLVEKETLNAFFEMQKSAKESGYYIIIDSGYRSYEYQQIILNYNLQKMGDQAYWLVAQPGCSEHQTGLAIDVALYINNQYVEDFDDAFPQIKWLFENAYKFGFILRYPKGKEYITGYSYEPWHFRYVGKTVSLEMYLRNIETLEEYLELNKSIR